MKSLLKISAILMLAGAFFAGCGSSNNGSNNNGGCPSGQINTVQGCGNTCTTPNGLQGGFVNNFCQQAVSGSATTASCTQPGYQSWPIQSGQVICCPPGLNPNQTPQYAQQYCTLAQGGSGQQCQPGWFINPQTGQCIP